MGMTLEQAGQLGPPDKHFRVICLASGQSAEVDSNDPATLHAAITCPPEAGCCQEDHDHYDAATPACHPLVIQPRIALTIQAT